MPNEPVLYEMHMHTPLCKHARGERKSMPKPHCSGV